MTTNASKNYFYFNWLLQSAHIALKLLIFIGYIIESIIFRMVLWYDLYMYSPLQIHLSPYMACIPRFIQFRHKTITVFNANIVTYSRTLLIIPIAWCLKYNCTISACLLVLFHDFLDHVDGIVAKVQRHRYGENIDDPLLGGFMDAFCDKIVNVVCLWTILQETHFQQTSFYISFTFVLLCYTIIIFETILGVVRVQDYFTAVFNENKISVQGSTSATMEGKLKETLESIGLAFLCLSTAYASLMAKIQARNTKETKKTERIDLLPEILSVSLSD
ncbi:unnamed protein product [Adineta steineri]|uniref:Uncharacterized protein n=1 Tax=Adineta steineri TaxID=433720 RepID=A0A815E504_9BILA|nr:unnamed protein product [Adineta steineri]